MLSRYLKLQRRLQSLAPAAFDPFSQNCEGERDRGTGVFVKCRKWSRGENAASDFSRIEFFCCETIVTCSVARGNLSCCVF